MKKSGPSTSQPSKPRHEHSVQVFEKIISIEISHLNHEIPIGEAEYVPDIAPRCNEVHAVFVVSSMANCEIESIDSSAAEVVFYKLALLPSSMIQLPFNAMREGVGRFYQIHSRGKQPIGQSLCCRRRKF